MDLQKVTKTGRDYRELNSPWAKMHIHPFNEKLNRSNKSVRSFIPKQGNKRE